MNLIKKNIVAKVKSEYTDMHSGGWEVYVKKN